MTFTDWNRAWIHAKIDHMTGLVPAYKRQATAQCYRKLDELHQQRNRDGSTPRPAGSSSPLPASSAPKSALP